MSFSMDVNPICILNEEEMIRLYKETEKQAVTLLNDLNLDDQEIFKDHTVSLRCLASVQKKDADYLLCK